LITELTKVLLSIAAVLSPLAAVAAFLITYREYAHHYTDKRKALKTAIEAGLFTLFFFLALGLFLAIILPFCV
jgi:purine-cytosine permease-like protein